MMRHLKSIFWIGQKARLWKKPYSLAVCIAAAALASCSVKEDRAACPCLLVLDLSSADAASVPDAYMEVFKDGTVVHEDSLRFGGLDRHEVQVPSGNLHLRVWAGGGDNVYPDGLDIPVGNDCPKIYMHDSELKAYGERVVEVVDMRKNHCVLTVMTEQGQDFSHAMRIIGNVSGYTSEGLPRSGKFEYELDAGCYDDGWKVVLPRQLDESLVLQVDDRDGAVKTFALGQYIMASGYDWNAPDLEDVTISLDYALTEMTISINGWESVYTFDAVL